MDTLVTLAAQATLQSRMLPTECLEQIVESNRVYGLLYMSNYREYQYGGPAEYAYEGFYSSKARAERRAQFLFPWFCDGDNQFVAWIHNPVEQNNLIKASGMYYITEHVLSPHLPRSCVRVYFSLCGYVTNDTLKLSPGIEQHEFTLDQFNQRVTEGMIEELLQYLNDTVNDTVDDVRELIPEAKKRLHDVYGLVLTWRAKDVEECSCSTCGRMSDEYFDGLIELFGEALEETELETCDEEQKR